MTQQVSENVDVVIVGAGAAGLSAALTLGRARRSVLVVDDNTPRNAPAERSHAFLTRDGAPPSEIVEIGSDEAKGYGVRFRQGRATSAEQVEGGFRVVLDDGGAVRGRRLLITTGLTDGLPEIEGLHQQWGRGVLHCPYCHGWEVRDRAIGVIGTSPMAVHTALLWRQWSGNVTLFSHTAPELGDEQYERLAARGVRVIEGVVTAVESVDGVVSGIRVDGRRSFPVEVGVVGTTMTARSELLEDLGVEPEAMEMRGHVIAHKVPVDAMGATSVPGVYAAGNVTDPSAQIIVAAAAGNAAGGGINSDLVEEDTVAAVVARRG